MTAPDEPARDALDAALTRHLAGDAPANVGWMSMLVEAGEAGLADERVRARLERAGSSDERARLEALLALARAHPDAWATVRGVLARADHGAASDPDGWAAVFDRLARETPEAAVALYALGSPDLLDRATAEVVERMRGWGLVGPERDLLEIGCGYGRLSLALAPAMRSVVGLDVAPGMIARALERTGGAANVRFAVSSGRDLAPVPTASVDVVLAADVFPYLVGAGGSDLARAHVAEAARVLRPAGALLVLNYSYRGDPALDRLELGAVMAASGFGVERAGTRDFALWDALAFLGRLDGGRRTPT